MEQQKKMYKVLAVIPKRDGGGDFFARCGIGFRNKDDSINMYLDLMPTHGNPTRGLTLQLREMDESDMRPRDGSQGGYRGGGPRPSSAAALPSAVADGVPF